ncbi:MAG: hypothetical protein KatS3mg097_375 [Candidatus Parcubacteria bacterium]|nr:MAG: hypothetical protein KatS3mg097_375 [Candidatus Parcubacteria bacterium]
MNLNSLADKIRDWDSITKLKILFFLIVLALIGFFVIKNVFFGQQKSNLPCFRATIRIWSPFNNNDLLAVLNPLHSYCISFVFENKTLDDIDMDFIDSLLNNKYPHIVYLDDNLLNKYQEHLVSEPILFNVDTLISYYNKDYLNFLGLPKLKTIDDIPTFVSQAKASLKKDVYPVGLGSVEIRNYKEIIFSIFSGYMRISNNFKPQETFKKTMDFYTSFSDPTSPNFSYPLDSGSDIQNFAAEKLVVYFGFYQDKNEINKFNPRLNYEIYYFPNVLPPKIILSSKRYYWAIVKRDNINLSKDVLNFFIKKNPDSLDSFIKKYDLVSEWERQPSQDKQIVLESFKNYGTNIDYKTKLSILRYISDYLNNIDNPVEANKILNFVNSIRF